MLLMRLLLLIMMVTFYGAACNHTSKMTAANMQAADNLHIKNSAIIDKIAFLTFEVILADSVRDQYSFKLINKTFAEGTLKQKELPFSTNEPFYIYYKIAGDNEAEQVQGKVPNPLVMEYEYPGEIHDLKKAIIKSKKGEFVVRFQLRNSLKHIYFYKADTIPSNLKQIYHALL